MLNKFIWLIILFPCAAFSQEIRHCGYLQAKQYLLQTDIGAAERIKQAEEETENLEGSSNKMQAQAIYTIPVVFHVLHTGGPENISDVQIHDALSILNKDFSKLNPDTANIVGAFQGIAADCQIEFILANLDENGNCTSGITRHYDKAANWEVSSSNYKYTWNRTRYLNVYVVKTLPPGIAAYTFLPGTSSAIMDAIVVMHSYVGSMGTGNPGGSRVLTHEVGHWLNLQHTWGSNNQPGVSCGDDGVGDTPPTKGFSYCNLANADVCMSGIEENVQNYMEYAFCQNMFTLGQRNRMHNCLSSSNAGRVNLWSPANLQFTGVGMNPQACPPVADFHSNVSVACVGDSVRFTDYSYNGTIQTWEWSSPSAIAASTLQNGTLVFHQSGPATVQLKVSNANGIDSLVKVPLILLPGSLSGTNNLIQSFENSNFPDSLWTRTLPEYGSPFQTNTVCARTGSQCIWINNYFDNPNEAVAFFTPRYLFQGMFPSQLSFYYAYRQKSSSDQDKLKVLASIDCGNSWTQELEMAGAALATATEINNSPFYPSSQQFSLATIDLSAYSNEELYLKFEFLPDPAGTGNNLFIDDVLIEGVANLQEKNPIQQVGFYPNPANTKVCLTGIETPTFLHYKLMDALGNCVYDFQKEHASPCFEVPESLMTGLYFLKLQTHSGSATFKIFLQK